jgi:diadenosine tetraphosphate (Ap4A) HIT family hydrolase
MHFHGHMHKRYEWDNNGTKTIGLNLENERHSRGVLDTKDNSFEFNPYQVQIDPLMPVWK